MPDIPLSVGSKLELLRDFVFAKFPYTSPYTHDLSAYAYCPIQCIIYMTEAPRVLHFSALISTVVYILKEGNIGMVYKRRETRPEWMDGCCHAGDDL